MKRVSTGIAFAFVVIGLVYYVFSTMQDSLRETATQQAQLTAANAVSVLPSGTQEAWIAYVDRRFAEAIQFKAGAISVDDESHEAKYVSLNTPYQVSCSPALGGSVEFGYGDGAVTVPIYGWLNDRKAEPPPSLGVIKSSLAAANLSRTLCERISLLLRKIVVP
jgi:hypothetical protein